MSRQNKPTMGDNPMTTLTGGATQKADGSARARYDAAWPAVSCRLPRATEEELQAIADAHGIKLGVLAALALADFLTRYQAGKVTLTVKDVPAVRKVAEISVN